MNRERVKWHHATFGFPFASSFIKALNRDVPVPGLSSDMVRANQPTSLTKSIARIIKQKQGIQSTTPNLASVPEEPPDPTSFCEDTDSSEFLIHPFITIFSPNLLQLLTLSALVYLAKFKCKAFVDTNMS